MPTYDYRCRKCHHRFELFHSIKDSTAKRCPRCRGKAERVPSAGAGILFKGSGFYITDYRSRDYQEKARKEKGGGDTAKSDAGGKSKADSPGTAKPTERRGEAGEKKPRRSGGERSKGSPDG